MFTWMARIRSQNSNAAIEIIANYFFRALSHVQQYILYSVYNCFGLCLEEIAFKDRSFGQMTQCLIHYNNFRDLITHSTFTHVLKGAENLQLPLNSEDSAFGESTPYQTESMLRNKLLCSKPRNVLLCVGNKSHVQVGKIFRGLSIFEYVLNLLCTWERSSQYAVPACCQTLEIKRSSSYVLS